MPGAIGPGLLWVDRSGAVVGPATDPYRGYHVDGDGNFWYANALTGAITDHPGFRAIDGFTSDDCTTGRVLIGARPKMVFRFDGIHRAPPAAAVPQPFVIASLEDSDGSCVANPGYVSCDEVPCYAMQDVLGWPVLTAPPPFDGPLHAEFQW